MKAELQKEYDAIRKQIDEVVAAGKLNDADMQQVVVGFRDEYSIGVIVHAFAEHEIAASKKRLSDTS